MGLPAARVILSGTQSQRLCEESNSAGANRGEYAVWDLGRCAGGIYDTSSVPVMRSITAVLISPSGERHLIHRKRSPFPRWGRLLGGVVFLIVFHSCGWVWLFGTQDILCPGGVPYDTGSFFLSIFHSCTLHWAAAKCKSNKNPSTFKNMICKISIKPRKNTAKAIDILILSDIINLQIICILMREG